MVSALSGCNGGVQPGLRSGLLLELFRLRPAIVSRNETEVVLGVGQAMVAHGVDQHDRCDVQVSLINRASCDNVNLPSTGGGLRYRNYRL